MSWINSELSGITVTLKTVMFMGRIEAAAEPPRPDWAVISLSEWGAEPAKLKDGWQAILRMEFHDIEEPVPDEPFDLFTPDQARQIVRFVQDANTSGATGVLVHCRAGISRSAAVAKWIAGKYGLRFPESYSLYNKHVYRVLVSIDNS
jgi:predicted protein tyrosine phosphatase